MRRGVVVLMCCGLVWAQGQAPADPNLGQIEGRVTNSVTGEPIRKATLTAHGTAGDYTATSDASGHFLIDRVAPGSYNVTAQRQNFSIQNYGATKVGMPGTLVPVGAGKNVSGIDVKLVPFGVISGKVLDEDGDPVTGAQVTVMKWGYTPGGHRLQPAGGGGSTNDRGEYRIYNLPPGKYVLAAQSRDSEAFRGGGTLRRVGSKPATPPSETYVPTYYPSSRDTASAATIPLAAGQEAPGMDIQLRKSRVYSVQGKVTGIAKTERLSIQRYPKESTSSAFFGGAGAALRPEDGSFTFGGVAPGQYTLIVRNERRVVARQDISVGDGDLEGVTLVVTEPGIVKGHIQVEGAAAAGTAGQGGNQRGTRVWLTPVEGVPVNSPNAVVTDTGSFELTDVAQDRYKVGCVAPAGMYVKSVVWNGHPLTDSVVEMGGGGATLELIFAPTSAQIEGDVRTADDQPAPGVRVLLVPGSRRDSDFRLLLSDQQGHFTAKNVAPGSYTALAMDGELYGMPDPGLLKALEKETTAVHVDENGHATVALKVISEAALEAVQ